mmetsp:Transcript_46627/g.92393  ORF Transcript_46627/g.92393 Transcript_46627/m.92393 type:complete len:86 (+) Transcript_46627:1194-1451(+)
MQLIQMSKTLCQPWPSKTTVPQNWTSSSKHIVLAISHSMLIMLSTEPLKRWQGRDKLLSQSSATLIWDDIIRDDGGELEYEKSYR